jgi:hypothetical protein
MNFFLVGRVTVNVGENFRIYIEEQLAPVMYFASVCLL